MKAFTLVALVVGLVGSVYDCAQSVSAVTAEPASAVFQAAQQNFLVHHAPTKP